MAPVVKSAGWLAWPQWSSLQAGLHGPSGQVCRLACMAPVVNSQSQTGQAGWLYAIGSHVTAVIDIVLTVSYRILS